MRYRKLPAFRVRGSRRVLLTSGAIGLLVLLLASPVEIPDSIEVPGQVLPAREWVVVRTPDGAVSASLTDYRDGAVEVTYAAEPARGDAVFFRLTSAARRSLVRQGDTVGVFVSGEVTSRQTALVGEIGAARAQLRLYEAGAKASVVEAAWHDARRAEAARSHAAEVHDRLAALAERGVVAQHEAADAASALRLADADADAAQARYEVARTGTRIEQRALARAEIAALEAQAASLAERARLSTLVAPFSGQALRVFSRDTLLAVADTAAALVAVPVPLAERSRVKVGQPVAIRTAAGVARGRLVDLRPTMARTAGPPYLLAMAEVESGGAALLPGQYARCTIELGTQPPLAFMQQLGRRLLR